MDARRREPAGLVVVPADRPGLQVEVALQPLRRGDVSTTLEVFDGMSAEARRTRFLSPTPRLTGAMLRLLTDVDHDRHGCWVAMVAGRPVGLGRYVRLAGRERVAEVALDVVDSMQGRGIGGLLVEVVSAAAASVGVQELLWLMSADNQAVLRLARRAGLRASGFQDVVEARTGLAQAHGFDPRRVRRLAASTRLAAGEAVAA